MQTNIRYQAMRDALLAVLPAAAPGLTVAKTKLRLLPSLPDRQLPLTGTRSPEPDAAA
jgi:hypothetical protein